MTDEIRVTSFTKTAKAEHKDPTRAARRAKKKVLDKYPDYEIVQVYWPWEGRYIAWTLRRETHYDATIF